MFLHELNKSEKKDFLELAYIAATLDGEITARERKLFESYRSETKLIESEYKIQKKKLEDIVSNLKKSDNKTQKIILLELMGLLLVDKEFSEKENKFFEILLDTWKIQKYELNRITRWVEAFNDLLVEAYVLIENKK